MFFWYGLRFLFDGDDGFNERWGLIRFGIWGMEYWGLRLLFFRLGMYEYGFRLYLD